MRGVLGSHDANRVTAVRTEGISVHGLLVR